MSDILAHAVYSGRVQKSLFVCFCAGARVGIDPPPQPQMAKWSPEGDRGAARQTDQPNSQPWIRAQDSQNLPLTLRHGGIHRKRKKRDEPGSRFFEPRIEILCLFVEWDSPET